MSDNLSAEDLTMSEELIQAFGGAANIKMLDACLTRLRITVSDLNLVDQEKLKTLGAIGVVVTDSTVQAIFGKSADSLRENMQIWLKNNPETGLAGELIAAHGGQSNIVDVDACMTRLRVSVKETDKVNQSELKSLGAIGVVVINDNIQTIFGKQSDALRNEMSKILK